MLCNLCPRKCNSDRDNGVGVCGVGRSLKIAKAYLHKWEEPCISGDKGSGTVFFSGCNLKCEYCQNWEISSECKGKSVTVEKLADIFRKLEGEGATNINLVSPSHYAKEIKEALDIYRPQIPIVYNSNGYDSLEILELLKGYIEIYLVDFKYMDNELSGRLSRASDYPNVVKVSIKKMRELQPHNIYRGDILQKGVIIRHLVLPNHVEDSLEILKWIKENISEPCVSIMGQYVPMFKAKNHKDICRKVKPIEYKVVVRELERLGLDDGYIQDLNSASEEYTPIWDYEGLE